VSRVPNARPPSRVLVVACRVVSCLTLCLTVACPIPPPSVEGFGNACTVDGDCVAGVCQARLCARGVSAGGPVDAGPAVDAGDLTGDWSWRVRLTIDNPTAETLVDVPVPVRLTDADLAPGASLLAGADLAFVDDTGATWAYDVERWQVDGEHLVWLRAPELPASSSTALWLFYGDATAADLRAPADVFRNDYVAVWHLGEVPTGETDDIADARGGSPATSSGMTADAAIDGALGGALAFDGADDWLLATQHDTPTAQMTLSLWMRPAIDYDSGSARADLLYQASGGRPHMTINREDDGRIGLNIQLDGADFDDVQTSNASWVAGQLYSLAFTFDGTDWRTYVDGAPGGPVRNHPGASDPASGLSIGATPSPGQFFTGMIDEVRLSSVARSAAWIAFAEAAARAGVVTLTQPQPL